MPAWGLKLVEGVVIACKPCGFGFGFFLGGWRVALGWDAWGHFLLGLRKSLCFLTDRASSCFVGYLDGVASLADDIPQAVPEVGSEVQPVDVGVFPGEEGWGGVLGPSFGA